MTPNPSIRMTSVIHTLEDVVFPAVDPANSLAQEQCGLVLAQLRMLLRHLPWIPAYHRKCRDALVGAIRALPEAVGGPRTLQAADEASEAALGADGFVDPAEAFHAMGFKVEALLRAAAADGDAEYRKALDRAVLDFSRGQTRRERVWFKDAGFDPRASELEDLADLTGPSSPSERGHTPSATHTPA